MPELPELQPSLATGSVIQPTAPDTTVSTLLESFGGMAIEAHRGAHFAEAQDEYEKLNKTVLSGLLGDKTKLDDAREQGVINETTYKIKLDKLLKEQINRLPGQASKFKQIAKDEQSLEITSLFKSLDVTATQEAKRMSDLAGQADDIADKLNVTDWDLTASDEVKVARLNKINSTLQAVEGKRQATEDILQNNKVVGPQRESTMNELASVWSSTAPTELKTFLSQNGVAVPTNTGLEDYLAGVTDFKEKERLGILIDQFGQIKETEFRKRGTIQQPDGRRMLVVDDGTVGTLYQPVANMYKSYKDILSVDAKAAEAAKNYLVNTRTAQEAIISTELMKSPAGRVAYIMHSTGIDRSPGLQAMLQTLSEKMKLVPEVLAVGTQVDLEGRLADMGFSSLLPKDRQDVPKQGAWGDLWDSYSPVLTDAASTGDPNALKSTMNYYGSAVKDINKGTLNQDNIRRVSKTLADPKFAEVAQHDRATAATILEDYNETGFNLSVQFIRNGIAKHYDSAKYIPHSDADTGRISFTMKPGMTATTDDTANLNALNDASNMLGDYVKGISHLNGTANPSAYKAQWQAFGQDVFLPAMADVFQKETIKAGEEEAQAERKTETVTLIGKMFEGIEKGLDLINGAFSPEIDKEKLEEKKKELMGKLKDISEEKLPTDVELIDRVLEILRRAEDIPEGQN